ILAGEGRAVRFVEETRQRAEECGDDYRARLGSGFRASGAHVAWLCVPPGEHVPAMLNASLDSGLNVMVEQPWVMGGQDTQAWIARAAQLGRLIGVHYEYCLLDDLAAWKCSYEEGRGCEFGGVFHHSRSGHLGLPAMDALGTHLLSMREFAVPEAAAVQIHCGYELANERRVWLGRAGRRIAEIDFIASQEPVIQRFISRFEAAIGCGEFTFDLAFAARVGEEAEKLKQATGVGNPK